MPIFDYECRKCGEQFELLVLKGTVAACPACQGQDLEQLISGFAVSSESISQANLQAKKVAEIEEIREHAPDYGIQKKEKKK
jgi:putative FmdB family regulatory protein